MYDSGLVSHKFRSNSSSLGQLTSQNKI